MYEFPGLNWALISETFCLVDYLSLAKMDMNRIRCDSVQLINHARETALLLNRQKDEFLVMIDIPKASKYLN